MSISFRLTNRRQRYMNEIQLNTKTQSCKQLFSEFSLNRKKHTNCAHGYTLSKNKRFLLFFLLWWNPTQHLYSIVTLQNVCQYPLMGSCNFKNSGGQFYPKSETVLMEIIFKKTVDVRNSAVSETHTSL